METAPRNQTSFPLHEAVESGNLEVLKALLDNGGHINDTNNNGDTLLHVAVIKSQELVTLLLEGGANPQLQNIQGDSPLLLAIKFNPNCVPLILRNGSGKDIVNIPDKWGYYPLHYAMGNDTELKMLLDNGHFNDCKDNEGQTVLHLASSRLYPSSFANEKDCDFYYNIAKRLLMHGAEVNSKGNHGNTPLHITYESRIAQLLLQNGAEVNSQNWFGRTILHRLVNNLGSSNMCFVDMLLDWGASLTLKDSEGRTPLDISPKLLDSAKKHNVRRACVKLSDLLYEEEDLKNYKSSCLEEAAKLKIFRFRKNCLHDIFDQYSDPKFLSNERLQQIVGIPNYMNQFPIYGHLLQSTYKLAEKRSCMLEDATDTLQTPLPRETTWYILTFVDDDSLRNVVKAKYLK